ncbi:O-antigen ligase family protein [Niallia sp. FSL W8-0635]|uniref:O-antigen ligase family protein n=1 Tax=Niallia sp. FSL W8-0635 TaxID=2975337 RepID=UPI0030F93D62
MTFLTGVFYGLLSPLNPEFRSFFLFKYGSLILISYIIVVFYLPFMLKKTNDLNKKVIIIVLFISIGITIPTVVFYLLNDKYDIGQFIRVILYIPIFVFVVWRKYDLSIYLIKFSFLFNFVGVYQYIMLGDSGRVESLFSHPNFYSIYLIVIIIFILEKLNFDKEYKRHKNFYYLYIFFMMAMILLGTGARTSFITLLIILVFNYFLRSRDKIRTVLRISIISFLLLIVFKVSESLLMTTRIFNMSYGNQYTDQINSFEWRILRWYDGLAAFNDFPGIYKIFGHGWQSSRIFSERFVGFSMHNEYIRMLVDFGVIGFIVYVSLIIFLVYISFKNFRIEGYYSLFLISVVVMIAGLTENIFVSSESFSILILSIANSLAILNIKKSKLLDTA